MTMNKWQKIMLLAFHAAMLALFLYATKKHTAKSART